jgi:hypothetical protein
VPATVTSTANPINTSTSSLTTHVLTSNELSGFKRSRPSIYNTGASRHRSARPQRLEHERRVECLAVGYRLLCQLAGEPTRVMTNINSVGTTV